MKLDFHISELDRLLSNIVHLGEIVELDYDQARARVNIGNTQSPERSLLTDWLPWLMSRAGSDIEWWAPEKGEQVLLLSPAGDLTQAIILGALSNNQQLSRITGTELFETHRTIYRDGTQISYNSAEHILNVSVRTREEAEPAVHLSLDADGKVTLEAIDDVTITTASQAKLTAVGDVVINTDSKATLIAADDVIINTQGAAHITAQRDVAVTTKGNVSLTAQQNVTINASKNLNLNANGVINLKSQKINLTAKIINAD